MKQTNKHSSFAKISALKAAEEQFEYNQQLLRATIDSSMDMIQVFKAVRNEQNEIVDFTWILNKLHQSNITVT